MESFKKENIEVKYENDKVLEVMINQTNLDAYFKLFNESNYHAVETLYIPPEFEAICSDVFDIIKEFVNDKKYVLANSLADFLFSRFTILWNYYLMHQKHMLGTVLWQHVCEIVWKDKEKCDLIHKGTPYFFLGTTQLMQGNIDSAFLFISNAIEEDKKYSKNIGDVEFYKKLPAYFFSSLIDDKNNYLLPYVIDAKSQINKFIHEYNSSFSSQLNMSDFNTKFLENNELESVKFFFVYTLISIINYQKKLSSQLSDTDFSKLKNANIIFNLCLIVDKVMQNKTNGRFISDSVKKISLEKFQETETLAIFKALDFENDFENALNKCLNLNFEYNSKSIKPEVLTLITVWGLRNFGGHNIKIEPILETKYEEIIQQLMNALFIGLDELY